MPLIMNSPWFKQISFHFQSWEKKNNTENFANLKFSKSIDFMSSTTISTSSKLNTRAHEAVDNVYVNLFWWVIGVSRTFNSRSELKCGKVNCWEEGARKAETYGVLIWITWLALVDGGRKADGRTGWVLCFVFSVSFHNCVKSNEERKIRQKSSEKIDKWLEVNLEFSTAFPVDESLSSLENLTLLLMMSEAMFYGFQRVVFKTRQMAAATTIH